MSFSVDCLTALSDLKSQARIHVIGVCGVAMAQIAVELSRQGFIVSGSDKEFFEPMSSLLKESSVSCSQGYKAENLSDEIDLVVIGNSVTSNNPEVLAAKDLMLPFTIFPKLLAELVISGRHSIVVSGTHGKTTGSGMLAFVMEDSGLSPSYFVGGKAAQLSSGLKVGNGLISVVEGDEYDSAFFAKFPKFHFYKPDTLIITSIEFDHADIYPDLDAIKNEFFKLVDSMPQGSTIIACLDDDGVRDFLARLVAPKPRIVTYGEHPDSSVVITFAKRQSSALSANFRSPAGYNCEIVLGIPGRYNLKNAVAALLALESAAVPINSELLAKFSAFKGVNRRQQVWLQSPLTLIEDFAHHPTAVRETLRGIKEWLPERRLIAIFEPRSNTSRKKIFQNDYVAAFQQADIVLMKEVEQRSLDSSEDLFDVDIVCQEIAASAVSASSFAEVCQIEDWVKANAKQDDIIVVMSNGAFGGLIKNLAANFKS